MKSIGQRITFVDHGSKTTIVIEPEKKFWINTMMGAWLAMWYGKEKMKIDEVGLHIKKSIINYGKSVVYYHENIEQISLIYPEPNSLQSVWESSPWINGGERFQFVYREKTVKFGKKIDQKDANVLLNLLLKRSREFIKK